MELQDVLELGFTLLWIAVPLYIVYHVVAAVRSHRLNAERGEAMFRSMFPDLAPHFHPAKLLDYVRARRMARPKERVWRRPAGFDVDSAEFDAVDGRERVTLRDAAGAALAQFFYEEHAEGGVLRVGKGKFTVVTEDAANPRVRYWHPDREFKWKRGVWQFQSRVADREIESSSSSGSTSFSDSSSSGASVARGAAAGAGIAAAGGAFDGGGASQSWDDAGSEGGDASSSAAATAY